MNERKRKGSKIIVSHPYTKDMTFDSIAAAGRFLNMSRQSINRYLWGDYQTCRRGFTFRYAEDEDQTQGAGEMHNLASIVQVGQSGFAAESFVPYLPKIVVQRIHPDAIVPTYTSEGDSGMDVYAVEDLTLPPGSTALCHTGILIETPRHPRHDYGYRWEIQARPRSGVSYKTAIRVANAPGTIDNFYRGEVKIILDNIAQREYELDTERDDDIPALTHVSIETVRSGVLSGLDGKEVVLSSYASVERGTVKVRKGDRVAQLVFVEVIRPLEIVEGVVSTNTDRGVNGFGSSGS